MCVFTKQHEQIIILGNRVRVSNTRTIERSDYRYRILASAMQTCKESSHEKTRTSAIINVSFLKCVYINTIYRVGQKSKPQIFVHISSPNIDRF